MAIIDITYFRGEINIAGMQQDSIKNRLNLLISKYEKEYLQSCLGYSLWKLFTDGLEAETPEARWTALRDGAAYTDGKGVARYWSGLKNDDRLSPIADYVYYYYSRDNVTFTTTSGEAEGKQENAANASSALKHARAYNSMVFATRRLQDYLSYATDDADEALYPEWDIAQTDCEQFQLINLYNL